MIVNAFGGQIMGHNASEIISEITLAITLKAKADLVVVSDIIGEEVAAGKTISTRNLSHEHFDMVEKVAEDICKKVDKILMKQEEVKNEY